MVMVETFKNIAVIAVVIDFCTGLGTDHIFPGRDHAGPSWDISSGYVLEAFFNLEQFGHGRDM